MSTCTVGGWNTKHVQNSKHRVLLWYSSPSTVHIFRYHRFGACHKSCQNISSVHKGISNKKILILVKILFEYLNVKYALIIVIQFQELKTSFGMEF